MKRIKELKFILYFLVICTAFLGCQTNDSTPTYQPTFAADTASSKTLIWGFPSFLYCENTDLIVKYLNKRLRGTHIVVKACVNWNEYVSDLDQNKFDISVINGIQAVEANTKGYSIYGKIMDDSQYTAVVFARKDANIVTVADLKGKSVAMTPSQKIPGTMMSLYYLYEQGLNVNQDIKKVNVSSFESAIVTTYLGKSEAGLSLKRNWTVYVRDNPEVLSRLELKWETPPLINNALIIHNTVDKEITAPLLDLFFSMHTNQEGKEALKKLNIGGFERANSATFKPAIDFKKKYDSVIH